MRLLVLGIVSLLGYGWITWISFAFKYGQGHQQRPLFTFLAIYLGLFVFYGLAIHALQKISWRRQDLFVILGFALLFRVLLLFSQPIQEDDFYRYLWDGKVVASGLNPYSVTPQDVMERGSREESARPYVRILADDPRFSLILSRVNHPEVATIYPPLAQGIFALAALVAPGSLLALRLTFLGFDLGVCGLLLALLRRLTEGRKEEGTAGGFNPLFVLIYAWSPLVIKETINSAHYDVVPTFFLLLAVWLALRGTTFSAQTSLACATLGKVYPVLLVPVFVWRTWATHGRSSGLCGLGVIVVVITLGYAPFSGAGEGVWRGTVAFAEQWQTNSLFFPLLHRLIGERWLANMAVALVLGCVILILPFFFNLRDEQNFVRTLFLVLGVLFLVSPVGNPWYFLWLVPFLCFFPYRSWLLLSGLLSLYYMAFYFIYQRRADTFRWVIWLEYVPFYVLLIAEWWKSRAN